MSGKFVDLHTHSTASDGSLTPTELVLAAQRGGLAGIALTDHDSGGGLAEAYSAAAKIGLRFVPGIEISAEAPPPATLHLLGYFIDYTSPALVDMSRILLEGRNNRNPRIIARLNELGCKITMDQVLEIAHRNSNGQDRAVVVGRPHIAQALVESHCVNSLKQAFDVYLGMGGSAYFDKERLTPRQAIDCIHRAGGLVVLAHPVQLRAQNHAHLQHMIESLIDLGLDGLEVWHSDHRPQDSEFIAQIAAKHKLLVTGGSDFHGTRKPDIAIGIGRDNVRIPEHILDELESAWKARRQTASPAA